MSKSNVSLHVKMKVEVTVDTTDKMTAKNWETLEKILIQRIKKAIKSQTLSDVIWEEAHHMPENLDTKLTVENVKVEYVDIPAVS